MINPIVTTDWLAGRLDDPRVRVLEISSELEDTTYRQGHIPGALRWFWKDLCWHATDREFVTPDMLAERLGPQGISANSTLVLYGHPVQYGTYALWSLTMAGHEDLRVLDGGRTKWIAEGRPLTTEVAEFSVADYKPKPGNTKMRLGRENLREHLGDPDRVLLDVRSPEEYSGERVMEYGTFDHGAERGGRIPGAVHLYFRELLNSDDSFKPPEQLREMLNRAGANPAQVKEIVCYCRLSHRASLAWTAMTHVLGYSDVKIYDGSWTEWGSIVGYPVEK
ncbi:MAG: sulfurtransferase [Gammaproteobacteria bacterium]|nr:sulfurtransferase [Gammaproteobacteria bacterium]